MTAATRTSPRTSRIAIALLLAAVALTAVIVVAHSGTPRPPERVPSTITTVKSATTDTIRAPNDHIPAALRPPTKKKTPATSSSTLTSTQSAGAGTSASAGAGTSTVPNAGTGGSGAGSVGGTGGTGGSGGSGNSGCSELGPC